MLPPRGFSIRRPPKVCQRRAKPPSNWLCPITAGQSRHSFEQFVRAIRSEVFFPLSFPFPRSLGITGARLQKIAFCVLLAHLGRFFRLPNRTRKMTSKKGVLYLLHCGLRTNAKTAVLCVLCVVEFPGKFSKCCRHNNVVGTNIAT